jgi:capsular exopolysaccharide synthesis family protein
VSRINEALVRAQSTEPAEPSSPVFNAAWTVTDGQSADTPEAAPGPLSLDAPATATPGVLVRFSSQWRERLAGGEGSDAALTEQFRQLAATLHHAHRTNGLRNVMFTSASPGDGKTLSAVNLAVVLAESYRYRVLLIDADLRRPSIPNLVDLSDGCGLADALTAPVEQKLALVPITSRLTLLPAGRPISNSLEALTSPRMRHILDEAAERYDWVILDAPPVGAATDARVLSQMVGGTLLVVHAGKTQAPEAQRAIDAIGRQQIIGVVLNGVDPSEAPAHYYYYGTAGA